MSGAWQGSQQYSDFKSPEKSLKGKARFEPGSAALKAGALPPGHPGSQRQTERERGGGKEGVRERD